MKKIIPFIAVLALSVSACGQKQELNTLAASTSPASTPTKKATLSAADRRAMARKKAAARRRAAAIRSAERAYARIKYVQRRSLRRAHRMTQTMKAGQSALARGDIPSVCASINKLADQTIAAGQDLAWLKRRGSASQGALDAYAALNGTIQRMLKAAPSVGC